MRLRTITLAQLEDRQAAERRNEMSHKCSGVPTSGDFRDGSKAEGCWKEGDLHYEQVAGNSGVYLVITNAKGEVIQDGRPWQMTV